MDRPEAAGSRVDANSIRINGATVGASTNYRVAMNNFLADGGDNFPQFRTGTNRYVGEIDLDAFARYIEFLEVVPPGPQNRITRAP